MLFPAVSETVAVKFTLVPRVTEFTLEESCVCVARGVAEPVPDRLTDCGEPVALSATEIAALRLPADAGVKVTVMVQVALAANEEPQLLVSPKLLAFVPVTEMLVMVRAAVPGFDSVMGKAVAGVPTSVLGKASGLGLSTA